MLILVESCLEMLLPVEFCDKNTKELARSHCKTRIDFVLISLDFGSGLCDLSPNQLKSKQLSSQLDPTRLMLKVPYQ